MIDIFNFKNKELNVIVGTPSCGKSNFALLIAKDLSIKIGLEQKDNSQKPFFKKVKNFFRVKTFYYKLFKNN